MLTEADLHDILEQATARTPFTPSMSAVWARHRRLRRRQQVLAVAVVAAVLAVAGGSAIGLTRTSTSHQLQPAAPSVGLGARPVAITPAELVASYNQWGPTRGNLVNDSAFIALVLQQWARPQNNDPQPWMAFPGPRAMTGLARVLFAGQTPEGVAAVVAQPSHDPHIRLYIGLLVGSSVDNLHLVYEVERNSLAGGLELSDNNQVGGFGASTYSADPHVLSFATSPAGRHVVILPLDPHDAVQISSSHTVNAGEGIRRHWTPVPTSGGVAVESVPAGKITDTMVQVTHDGNLIDQSPVLSDSPDGPPAPSNLLSHSDQIDDASGTDEDGYAGVLSADLWVRDSYGTAAAPYPSDPYGSRDFVNAKLKGGWYAELDQDWLPGDPAETVVSVQDEKVSALPAQVVSHIVTDPTAVLVTAVRLPHRLGWLVLGGARTTITGFRTSAAGPWVVPRRAKTQSSSRRAGSLRPGVVPTTRTRRVAVLHTDARTIQLRLVVDGQQQIVTRHG